MLTRCKLLLIALNCFVLWQRVRLIAAAKGVETEEIQIHLKRQPKWYIEEVNHTKQVPTIEHNGNTIRESAIIFGKPFLFL